MQVLDAHFGGTVPSFEESLKSPALQQENDPSSANRASHSRTGPATSSQQTLSASTSGAAHADEVFVDADGQFAPAIEAALIDKLQSTVKGAFSTPRVVSELKAYTNKVCDYQVCVSLVCSA